MTELRLARLDGTSRRNALLLAGCLILWGRDAQGEEDAPLPAPPEEGATQVESPTNPNSNPNPNQEEAPGVDTIERARELGMAGLAAFGRGSFEEAHAAFAEAEALVHSPVFQVYQARCLIQLGRVAEARALLQEVSAASSFPQEPGAWKRARAAARSELVGLPEASAIDPEAPQPIRSPTPDRSPLGAEHQDDSAQIAAETPTRPARAPGPRRWTGYERGAAAAYGTGGAGFLTAIVSGAFALAKASELKANCLEGSCRPEDEHLAWEATDLAHLATVGVIVGAVGGVTGTALLLLRSKRGARPATAQGGEIWCAPLGLGVTVGARF